jgi:RNA polymerase sigma-70 factor (ECF subfamily)
MLAEDLAQETFVKAFRNLAAFDTTRRLSSWLFRIAHNTAIDALRRTPHAVASLDGPRPASAAGAAEPAAPAQPDPLEHRALTAALGAALSQLRPEYRAAISLRYDESLSFEEIGQIMGVPEATARSHVHRARKVLSGILKAGGWAP